MATFELISNPLCPYPQRAAIQLAEKSVAYERVYIDLAHKPEWFRHLSPSRPPMRRSSVPSRPDSPRRRGR